MFHFPFPFFNVPNFEAVGFERCANTRPPRVRQLHFRRITTPKAPQLMKLRDSFHIQTLSPPKTIRASALGHSGIWWPATSTSGRITKRPSCARAISPNRMPATRNPSNCDFISDSSPCCMFSSARQGPSQHSTTRSAPGQLF